MDQTALHTRKPVQERSRERVEKVLAAAEQLLLEAGPEHTSIPEIARTSGVPRASIYQFFPNKYALFLAIGDIHLQAVVNVIREVSEQRQADEPLAQLIRRAVQAVAEYYNRHPVAGTLILGGPMSRNAYLSQEMTVQDIGVQVRAILATHWPQLSFPQQPDVITLGVELAFACMKHGYYTDGRISQDVMEEAAVATECYLSARVQASSGAQ